MHWEWIGSRNTERGRDKKKKIQLLSVLENSDWQDRVLDRYSTTGLIGRAPVTEEMEGQTKKEGEPQQEEERSRLLAPEYKSWSKESKQDPVWSKEASWLWAVTHVLSKSYLITEKLCVFGQATRECSLNAGSHYYYSYKQIMSQDVGQSQG